MKGWRWLVFDGALLAVVWLGLSWTFGRGAGAARRIAGMLALVVAAAWVAGPRAAGFQAAFPQQAAAFWRWLNLKGGGTAGGQPRQAP